MTLETIRNELAANEEIKNVTIDNNQVTFSTSLDSHIYSIRVSKSGSASLVFGPGFIKFFNLEIKKDWRVCKTVMILSDVFDQTTGCIVVGNLSKNKMLG